MTDSSESGFVQDGRASHDWDYRTGRCKQCGVTPAWLERHYSMPQYTFCTRPLERAVYQINERLGMEGNAKLPR